MIKSEKIGDLGLLYNGDCLEVMKEMKDNSVTGVCCDPPYGLEFMGKKWDSFSNNTNSALGGQSPANKNFQKWNKEWAREALRVCKPGAFMFVFGGSRTFHRLVCAVEDAGWIIRDTIMWIYGSGFPKSLNIGKAVDKLQGNEREVVGKGSCGYQVAISKKRVEQGYRQNLTNATIETIITKGTSEWEGYGTAFKPAFEPILVCMKPNDGSFADNALKWGVSGINIDAGRIGVGDRRMCGTTDKSGKTSYVLGVREETRTNQGRYPANLILQHHPDCKLVGEKKVKGIQTTNYGLHKTQPGAHGTMHDGWNSDKIVQGYADENSNETIEEYQCHSNCPIRQMNERVGIKKSGLLKAGHLYGKGDGQNVYASLSGTVKHDTHADLGYVSRYFKNLPPETPRFLYFPKASRAEREKGCGSLQEKSMGMSNGAQNYGEGYDKGQSIGLNRVKQVTNNHPTVKPLSLIKELCKLLQQPTDTIILDMFAGSGTLGVACEQLGINYILIEKEEEYCDIIKARVNTANEADKPIKRKKIKKATNTLIPWEEIDSAKQFKEKTCKCND